VLNTGLIGLSAATALLGVTILVLWAFGKVSPLGALVGLGVQPLYLLAYRLNRRGRSFPAACMTVVALLAVIVATDYQFGSGYATLVGYAVVTAVAAVLIDSRAALLVALFSVGGHVVVGVARAPASTGGETLGLSLLLLLLVILQGLTEREKNKALLHQRALSAQLTSANERLQRQLDEQSRAEMKMKRRSEELEVLREISLAVTAQLELDELLSNTVKLGCRFLNVSAGSIYLLDDETGGLELVVNHGMATDYIGWRLAPGEGLAGRVVQSGEPLNIQDYHQWEGRSPRWEEVPLTGVLGVPLKRRQQTIGVLSFEEISKARSFDEHDVWLASLFANQVAIAIDNARLFARAQRELAERERVEKALQDTKQELEKRNTRLEALYRIGQVVNGTLKTKAILDHLTDEAMRVTRASHGQVLVVQEENRCFHRHSLRGFTAEEAERARTIPLSLDRGINSRVYKTHQTVCVDDVCTEPGYFPLIPATRTELAVPIIRQGKVLGNLDLQSPEVGAFHDVDLDYLSALADQVAVALENARLFEEEQRQREVAESLQQVAMVLNSSLDLEEVIDKIIEQMRRVIPCDGAGLFLQADSNLVLSGGFGFEGALNGAQISLQSDLEIAQVFRRRKPHIVADVRAGSDWDPLAADPRVRGWMAAPLLSANRAIGVLTADSFAAGAYSPEDANALHVFANQAAVAIENARLFEQAQQEIGERKRAQSTLRTYADRLERSNRELEEFAYVASHDLQEPLRKVHAFGDRLQARYGQVLDEQGRDYLERMQQAAQRMQSLINGLLTYSRVTTRALPFVPVDLGQVVREVLSDLEVRIEQVNGRVEVGDLPTIDADPTQMRQLFQNLIGNALKFHRPEEPPLVTISAKLLDAGDQPPATEQRAAAERRAVTEEVAARRCQILVQDNGIGFDPKYLDRIFQVFQRLHGRGEYEGTGIGLATCRKIVNRHRGSITATSTPGQGATFIVTLPLEQPAEMELS
jgi:signal transduction histidine kinase